MSRFSRREKPCLDIIRARVKLEVGEWESRQSMVKLESQRFKVMVLELKGSKMTEVGRGGG